MVFYDSMYKIKQIPEDFVVEEVSKLNISDKGMYTYALLTKRDYTTEKAVMTICQALRLDKRNINYAGLKDKKAITKQFISLKGVSKERIESLELRDINLNFVGFGNERLNIGCLESNKFRITIRTLTDEKISLIKQAPNYFDEQRFSQCNKEVGKLILKKNFEEAINKVLESELENNSRIDQHLFNNKNDFVGALLLLSRNTIRMYIHAYQSYLFNETVKRFIIKNFEYYHVVKYSEGELVFPREELANKKVKIIGFGTKLGLDEIDEIIASLMEEEKITQRDFIIPQLKQLSAEGSERNLLFEVENFKFGKFLSDELNHGKKKVCLEFELQKGSYATIVVKALFA